ncbi:hypothetical protein A0H81_08774 [Grifola frondosa]|uniref:Uncharacterized protein n=1 Tax=Grifola frondosa TaxID=5627 RepID=A0A1C7M7T9_GRIFR|nr:hypothetical protein A0H81_08774 [Grifola frondosa]
MSTTMLHSPTQRRPHPDIPAMPSHWNFEFKGAPQLLRFILQSAFQLLCVISLGHADLQRAWIACTTDDKTWTEQKDRLWDRISTITIIGGLLLGATAAFATTVPPMADILNYTERGPYMCIFCSFGLTFGSLIVGSAILFVMPKCTADWFRTTLMGSRSNICCTLVLIAYPFICMGVSTIIGAFGLLVAAWISQDRLVKFGVAWILILPASLILVFAWTQRPLRKGFTSHDGSSRHI